MRQLKYRLTGLNLMILNNSHMADPLNPLVQQKKNFTGKRKKTDEDLFEIAKLEWLGSCYWGKAPLNSVLKELDGASSERFFELYEGIQLPSRMIKAALIAGGKKLKLGTQIKEGVYAKAPTLLTFPGQQSYTAIDLWNKGDFSDTRIMTVNRAKISKTRFSVPAGWEMEINLLVDETAVDVRQVEDALMQVATRVGLGDYRISQGMDGGGFAFEEVQ